jgi:hypothetical protein
MTSAGSQPESQRPRGTRPPGPLARGIRTTLWLLIVVVGCYVLFGYIRLWNEWRTTTQPSDDVSASHFDPNALAPQLPLEGPWSFAKLDWNISSTMVAAAEVSARFDKLATTNADASDEQLPDVSPELFELAEQLGALSVERGGNQVFQLDRPNLKARLIARTSSGKPKVVALAVALPHSAESWQFFELIPRGTTASTATTSPQLLPLPASARRDGGRFAEDGQTLMELVMLDSNADELIALWKGAGWEVRPSGVGGDHEFSFLCARGKDVVYAWSADPENAIKNLMLVRVPDGHNTNAAESGSPSPISPPE